ncbi:HAD family hydrolase [Thermobifida halotolerans]|uniref:HAD family hydrolase n=1 Tax=Thermobifida halotolerans TaxID=483545 RepID=A0A399FTH2_9ACTN|nr:HAD family hydrolase [Thermobifida halotolerans]UOE19020.1 HAD family hydrolase [Thermobifida halotolerans]
MTSTTPAAFFDVDGTLTTATSMFRFLEYRLAAEGNPPRAYREERQRLRAMTAAGVPRLETNRAYFAGYRGSSVSAIAALAEEWFRTELRLGGFFNGHVLSALHEHRGAGHLVVLVSGSFRACLDPIARYVGADVVLCSEPETESGRYTGRVQRPMIGEAKSEAVRDLAARRRIHLPSSTGYGDHESDLPLLRSVGRATVVGTDPVMRELAARNNWRVLPGAPSPAPLPLPSTTEGVRS